MTAFSKTILGKILGGAAQAVATPIGLGSVAHAALDKVADGAQNVITGRNRSNTATEVATQQNALDAQNKVTQVGLNVQTGQGSTSVSGFLNTGAPTGSGFLQNAFYWLQNNVMVVIAIIIAIVILKKKKRR